MAYHTQIWTDASFDPNLKKAGISAILIRRESDEIAYISKAQSLYCNDNNEAELKAILLGLNAAKKYGDKRVTIVTDSVVAKNAVIHGHPKYSEIVREIRGTLKSFDETRIYNKHAHKKAKTRLNTLNNAVDILANLARKYR